jgi:glycerol-3-phosphate acyltransferase PlsY
MNLTNQTIELMEIHSSEFYAYYGMFCVAAYLLGSIPSAVWIGKSFYNIDVREHGSGNAGATNTFRVLGKGPGTIVLIMDILKGYLASSLVYAFIAVFPQTFEWNAHRIVNIQLMLGASAVIGHLLPLFAGFKGGKGIATLAGMIIALNPLAALCAIGIFLIVLLLTRFVSLGSMLGGLSIPVLFVSVFGKSMPEFRQPSVVIFTIVIAVLVVITHRKNINRLIHGNESKANLFPKHRRSN